MRFELRRLLRLGLWRWRHGGWNERQAGSVRGWAGIAWRGRCLLCGAGGGGICPRWRSSLAPIFPSWLHALASLSGQGMA